MEKRMLKKFIATLCIMVLVLPFISEIALAVEEKETKNFGIVTTNENGVGYKVVITDKNGNSSYRQVYKTFVVDANGSRDFNNGIFCLNAEKNFPAEGTTKYENSGDYTEKEEIKRIADNIYLPYETDKTKNEELYTAFLNKVFAQRIEEGKQLTPPTDVESIIKDALTVDDVIFVEQMAIWSYTESNFDWKTFKRTSDKGTTWQGYSELATGKYELMLELYEYFTKNNSKLPLETNLTDISLTKSNNKETIELSDGSYAVGPFKINNGTNTNFTAKLYDQSNKELTTYTLVDKNGNVLGTNVKNVLDKEFYVKVTEESNITKVALKITSTQTKTTKTLWTPESKTGDYQNLLLVKREPVTIEDSDEVPVEIPEQKIYDLALRKYITKVGENNITDRIPDPKYKGVSGDKNQFEYEHKKTPVELKPGDKVVYTITVYNEGNEDAKPTAIVDYLPEGLEYVSDSELNSEYKWQISADGKRATTAYTAEHEDLPAYDGRTLAEMSVKIECRVKEDVTDGTILTNVANIAGDNIAVNDRGNSDIDSLPELNPNTTKNEDTSSNVNLPGDLVSKYPDLGYKGNKDNKTDLDDSNYYYFGQEDDDDFEKVKVVKEEIEYLDLALRKYITTINGENKDREPQVDVSPLKEGKTTATYTHPKDALKVKQGDIVIYTIRVYNEGDIDAYADEITDYLPEGLGFLPNHKINYENGWQIQEGSNTTTVKLNTINKAIENSNLSDYKDVTSLDDVTVVKGKVNIKSTNLKYTEGGNDNILKAFDKENGTTLDNKSLQVACVVLAENSSKDIIKNIAAITDESDFEGKKVDNVKIKDRDSEPNEIDVSTYPDNTNIQDDDDFEKLILNSTYDLALKKYIYSVEGNVIEPSRLQKVNPAPLADGATDAEYTLDKTTVKLKTNNRVVYKISVFNEGDTDAKVGEIVDTLPEGLEFIPAENSEINKQYGWETFSGRTEGWESGIKTDYLKDTVIKAFDKTTVTMDSKEVLVELKVVATEAKPIKNIAEITKDDGDDGDSTPNNKEEKEDDEDYDTVIVEIFDLALQKFITEVNGTATTESREPMVSYKDGKFSYAHTKTPLGVANGNIVTYTIRVYNEGNQDGYVAEIKDDVPTGLIFLPNDELNKKYGWTEKNGEIRTDYLSKENSEKRKEDNLLKAFDPEKAVSNKNPDYRDVKVNFKVDQTKLKSLDTVIINTAEISKHTDKDGKDVTDKDSTPDNNKEGEDDIDKEYLQLKCFDLALVKYVSSVVVTEDGKTTTTQTGHNGTENPEPDVKVEIHRNKLDTTEVTFIYTIRVTNQGELEGYAKEVKDRIPAGLSFYKEDNPNWEISEDGIVVTNALADKLLMPGDSADVTIALRWNKSESNLGRKINTAEISKDYNKYNAPDIDSTPDNNKEGEDDQDIAPVLLSIKTGSEPIHIVLIISCITMLGAGAYAIKKFVL